MSGLPAAQQKSTKAKVLGLLGAVVGAGLGQYSGINLLIPLFATGLVWWGGSRLLKGERNVILPAFSVNAGHFLWLSLGLILVRPPLWATHGPDLVVYTIGLAWLVAKPSSGPIYWLGIYQIISLGVNGYSFAESAVGSGPHKALLIHLIWRALALYFMTKLFFTLRGKSASEAANTEN